jgi:N-methylhydantoinase A
LLGQVDLEVPRVALVTTKGFRDIVEIGRQRRAEVYNLFFKRPKMLVERRLRYEVEERVEHDGSISVRLNESELNEIFDEIADLNVASIAFSFLNSYANPAQEERAFAIASERKAAPYLTASYRISNEYREYERTSTAVVNASLMPIIQRYLTQLSEDLKGMGVKAPLYVMQSNGGLSTAENVAEKPATIVESGPAAGVIATAWLGELSGIGDIMRARAISLRYPQSAPSRSRKVTL